MRHRVANRKLGRKSAHRKAMFANMVSSLVIHERIETTLPKAKELKRLADRMVTLGKQGTLAARRRAIAVMRDKHAVEHLFGELAARFADRTGGYTRVLKLGFRHGDNAPMAMIEYLAGEETHAEPEKKERKAKKGEEKKAKKGTAEKKEKKAAPKKKKAAPKKSAAAKKKAARKTKKAGTKKKPAKKKSSK